jgi:hypothetical protein
VDDPALKLDSVSLVMIDTHCPELARLALQDTLAQVSFGKVLIFSPRELGIDGARHVHIGKWPSQTEYNEFLWHKLYRYLDTPYVLNIQWDAWVINADMWSDLYLDYDYIGAPWGYNDGLNVGNGTGIRSRRLLEFLHDNPDEFPVPLQKEDDRLCRRYRPELEKHGFRWAPDWLAAQFSFENWRPSEDSRHFMFHDSMLFPYVLSGERLLERVALMQRNDYITCGRKLDVMYGHDPIAINPQLAHD